MTSIEYGPLCLRAPIARGVNQDTVLILCGDGKPCLMYGDTRAGLLDNLLYGLHTENCIAII